MILTDFNDLHVVAGLKSVRDQLLAGLAAGESPAPPLSARSDPCDTIPSPGVDDYQGRMTLEQCLERFALTTPNAKVWDDHDKNLLKSTAARALMGKKVFEQWLDHDARRVISESFVGPLAAAAAARGGGGLSKALARYVYLYPTDAVWDREMRERVPMSALRYAIADCYDQWIKSESRAQLDVSALVFDPRQRHDPDTTINTFRGLPLKVVRDDGKCVAIRDLVNHLCNGDALIMDWLYKWLAFPLQHVGAKMASAILMHSDTQGTGKSLLFEEVIKPMYGEYSSTLSQHQLESQYTDWRSQLLFGLFEEIFSRDQKYSHTGTLKHMVTGKTQRIEKKFISGWEEANHMNAVFLSNEIQPFPIESSDRRWLVVWPQAKMLPDLKTRVLAEINDGGVEAFYSFLMSYPLQDFTTHTEPPVTPSKERIIEFGLPAWDVFYREWRGGCLDVPFIPCLGQDLFKVYRKWCERRREHVVSYTKFGGFLGVQRELSRRRDVHYDIGQSRRKGTFFIPHIPLDGWCIRDGESQAAYLGRSVSEFVRHVETSND